MTPLREQKPSCKQSNMRTSSSEYYQSAVDALAGLLGLDLPAILELASELGGNGAWGRRDVLALLSAHQGNVSQFREKTKAEETQDD